MGHERGSARIAAATTTTMMMMMMSTVFAAGPTVVTTVKWDLNVTKLHPDNTLALNLKTGDNILVFNYTNTLHNLVQVGNITAYTNCDKTGAINTYTSGNDTFAVGGEGKQYFICGILDHCKVYKMKLAVTAS